MTTSPVAHYSLVIPAYNEENRIKPLFDAITQFDGELIVVCDGEDGTADIVDQIAAYRPDLTIRCLRFDHRLGKGGGVIAGIQIASFPLVGYFDADSILSSESFSGCITRTPNVGQRFSKNQQLMQYYPRWSPGDSNSMWNCSGDSGKVATG